MNTMHEANDRQIALQAVQWREILKDAGAKERTGFVKWLLESRRHVRNYLLLTAFEKELKRIDPERKHDVDALLREAGAAPLTLSLSHKGRGDLLRTPASTMRLVTAIAASAVIAALSVWWASSLQAPTYVTAIGEQRSIALPDGSVVQLNTQSQVRMQFTQHVRTVRLLEGEALFTVQPDPGRPFQVDVGDSVIQALGTQFNVYRDAGGTTISVVEGLVEVRPSGTRIGAGEQARILTGGKTVRTPTADIASVLAWRERRLIFRNNRLGDIAAEFNRYNSVQQIRVEGDAVRDRRITGIFAADDPQLLVRFLAEDTDLSVEEDGHEIVIRQRETR